MEEENQMLIVVALMMCAFSSFVIGWSLQCVCPPSFLRITVRVKDRGEKHDDLHILLIKSTMAKGVRISSTLILKIITKPNIKSIIADWKFMAVERKCLNSKTAFILGPWIYLRLD